MSLLTQGFFFFLALPSTSDAESMSAAWMFYVILSFVHMFSSNRLSAANLPPIVTSNRSAASGFSTYQAELECWAMCWPILLGFHLLRHHDHVVLTDNATCFEICESRNLSHLCGIFRYKIRNDSTSLFRNWYPVKCRIPQYILTRYQWRTERLWLLLVTLTSTLVGDSGPASTTQKARGLTARHQSRHYVHVALLVVNVQIIKSV